MKKEEMIKKIREKVILANNPECKSYEEALNKEFHKHNCLVQKYEISIVDMIPKITRTILQLNSIIEYDTNSMYRQYTIFNTNIFESDLIISKETKKLIKKLYHTEYNGIKLKIKHSTYSSQGVCFDKCDIEIDNEYYKKHHNTIYTILGLPLTLERILVALKMYKNIQPLIAYDKNNLMCISIIKEQKISEITRIGIIANRLFSWQPNKILEEQSEETIKAIYDILL